MSGYIGDLSGYLATGATGDVTRAVPQKDNASLDMTDFLSLMVAQFQNQSIDNTADPADMLNQLVQMSMIQAITNITDATVMMYAGSLVGKEVTVGQFDSEGKLQEIVGEVTGTGMSGGQQIIFVNGESYYLSDIMAVGRLPDKNPPADAEKPEGPGGVEGSGGTEVPEIPGVPEAPETDGQIEHSDQTESTDPAGPDEARPDAEQGPEGTEQLPEAGTQTEEQTEQTDTEGLAETGVPAAGAEPFALRMQLENISDEIRGRRYVDLLGGPLYWG